MAIFITGTGTNVGKTLITSWLCLHTKAAYWKPIQTGIDLDAKFSMLPEPITYEPSDSETIAKIAGVKIYPETYILKKPLSPHAAAAAEKVTINPADFILPNNNNLIIEGAGGVLVPIWKNYTMRNLITQFNIPVIVVADSGLGTINHTCLTIEALRTKNIIVLGVIMNGEPSFSNKQAIEEYGNTKVLAEFPKISTINRENLQQIPLPSSLALVLKEHL